MANEKRTNYGINYGPLTNLNPVTGIRFGVIPVHELPFFYDEAEAVYPEFSPLDCDELGENYTDEEEEIARERFYELSEPMEWKIDNKECEMSHSQDDGDVFVTDSKYFTYAAFCSPCAPGACYLLSQCDENGPKAYCPPPDMFDEGECPIDIYSVETGMIVRNRSVKEEV